MYQNEYDITVINVVDGDTVDVDIDLGFGVTLRNERIRIVGIDTPESRTSDKVEDLFGEAAKSRTKELLANGGKLITKEDSHGEDMKGKFGRILGDFRLPDGQLFTEVMIFEGYAARYNGESKDSIDSQHLSNRQRLLKEGVISQQDYDAAIKLNQED